MHDSFKKFQRKDLLFYEKNKIDLSRLLFHIYSSNRLLLPTVTNNDQPINGYSFNLNLIMNCLFYGIIVKCWFI